MGLHEAGTGDVFEAHSVQSAQRLGSWIAELPANQLSLSCSEIAGLDASVAESEHAHTVGPELVADAGTEQASSGLQSRVAGFAEQSRRRVLCRLA